MRSGAEACAALLNEQVSSIKGAAEQVANKPQQEHKHIDSVLVSQVYSIGGYQRQCPRTQVMETKSLHGGDLEFDMT